MSKLNVLVVGSGGREHALAWALKRSPSVRTVESAPGNPGTAELGPIHPVAARDLDGLESLARDRGYDLVVIGPEVPLALGLANRLRGIGIDVFGPGEEGARLESSKAFAKMFMERHRIPTPDFRVIGSRDEGEAALREWGAPAVVKASGLAAGKGVLLCETEEEIRDALHACLVDARFGEAGATVILERVAEGEEVSIFAVTDGRNRILFPGSRDHKRAFDGDLGPNTGGMGAISPAPALTPGILDEIERTVIDPTLAGLEKDALFYRGVIYFGLMITADGPVVLEYNVRFGDPETQAVLPRLDADLGEIFLAAARGELDRIEVPAPSAGAAACVVAAAEDYPASGARGLPIHGIEEARAEGALVFHAGTSRSGGDLVAAGGRVLNVVGVGADLPGALAVAYRGLERVGFEGMRYRKDIGHRAAARLRERET